MNLLCYRLVHGGKYTFVRRTLLTRSELNKDGFCYVTRRTNVSSAGGKIVPGLSVLSFMPAVGCCQPLSTDILFGLFVYGWLSSPVLSSLSFPLCRHISQFQSRVREVNRVTAEKEDDRSVSHEFTINGRNSCVTQSVIHVRLTFCDYIYYKLSWNKESINIVFLYFTFNSATFYFRYWEMYIWKNYTKESLLFFRSDFMLNIPSEHHTCFSVFL